MKGGANIEGKRVGGATHLLNCCERPNKNHREMIKVLIDLGANVNAMKDDGTTPLMLCCFYGNAQEVELLINSGANIHAFNNQAWSLLHFVALRVNPENISDIIDLLLNKGLDINQTCNSGTTPFMRAFSMSNIKAARVFLDKGANPSLGSLNNATDLIIKCLEGGEYEFAKQLTARKLCDNTLLPHMAKRNFTLFEWLIDNGAPLDGIHENGDTNLHFVLRYNRLDLLKKLLAKGANVTIILLLFLLLCDII